MLERPPIFRLNRNAPLAKGLVFAGLGGGQCAGTLRYQDSSPFGNHGTLTNMDPATDWVWESTLGQWRLDFDGSNDVVTASGANVSGLAAASWSLWVKQASVGGSVYGMWLSSNTAYNAGFIIGRDNTAGNIIQAWIGGVPAKGTSSHFSFDVWQHVVVTFIGSTSINVYVNGTYKFQQTTTVPATVPAHSGLEIGANLTTGLPAKADIASPLMFSRVLSDSEISALADPSNVMLSGLIMPPARRIWGAVVATGRTGTIACPGQSATAAIAGTMGVAGSVACPGQASVGAADAAVGVAGSAACPGQASVAAIAAVAGVSGEIATAGQQATATIAATAGAAGTIICPGQPSTAAGAGACGVAAAAACPGQASVAAAAAAVAVQGAIACPGQAATAAIAGTVGAVITGSIACPGQQATAAVAGSVAVSGSAAAPGLSAVAAVLAAARVAGTLDCPGQAATVDGEAARIIPIPGPLRRGSPDATRLLHRQATGAAAPLSRGAESGQASLRRQGESAGRPLRRPADGTPGPLRRQ